MLRARTCATLLAAFSLTVACRKETTTTTQKTAAVETPAVISPELLANHASSAPDSFISSRASSPIHWQRWEPAMLDLALKAKRPVFVVIGSAQYPGCTELLEALDREPSLVKRVNDDFVPVLVDSDSCRESALLSSILANETQQPISFPFLLFLSPDGMEASWRPLPFAPGAEFKEIMTTSMDLVGSMWKESPDYFIRNSRMDHAGREERLPDADNIVDGVDSRKTYVRDAIRQLVSLYDADVGTLSGTGGLFPTGVLQCLAAVSSNPDVPTETASQALKAVKSFAPIILRSAMVDPLDGGIYTARGGSWDLPMSNRTCSNQARAIRALVSLYSATGDAVSLDAAINSVKFAEQEYQTPDGLFSNQRLPGVTPMVEWLWTIEQLEQALTPEEASLWKNICGISNLGNIPGEADPQRVFFRLNSLAQRMTPEAAAKKAGIEASKIPALVESGRKKLIKARLDRNASRGADTTPSALPSFRMISAYAALYTATGDPAWRTNAVDLAGKCRSTFTQGGQLLEQRATETSNSCDARAFTYAIAIQAALDLAEVTLDENWRIWAGDLSSTVSERFIDAKGRLLEASPESTPVKLPLEDRLMIFDDSTAGVMRMNISRLQALGQEPPPSLAPWLKTLPDYKALPIVYTDSILAASFGLTRVIVDLPANASDEWKKAASMLPLDRIARRIGSGSTPKFRFANGTSKDIASPEVLKKPNAISVTGS